MITIAMTRLVIAWAALRGKGIISGVTFHWRLPEELEAEDFNGRVVMRLRRYRDGSIGATFSKDAKIRVGEE